MMRELPRSAAQNNVGPLRSAEPDHARSNRRTGRSAAIYRFSTIFSALNFLVDDLQRPRPPMTLTRMPLVASAVAATSIIIVLGTPVLSGALLMLIVSRIFGAQFFTPGRR